MAEPQNELANCVEKFRPVLLTLAEAMILPALRGNLEASDLVQLTLLEAHCNADQRNRVHRLFPLLRVTYFACIAGVTLYAVVLAARPAACGEPTISLKDSPHIQVMNHLLATSKNMDFDEIHELCVESRELVTELSFDPADAKHFDQIKTKLKLTDQELQLYLKHGFVSVDHEQRYSFDSAYYQSYSAHLPVFVSSEAVRRCGWICESHSIGLAGPHAEDLTIDVGYRRAKHRLKKILFLRSEVGEELARPKSCSHE